LGSLRVPGQQKDLWDDIFDVIVVGSGGGALTAALLAADGGARVVVAEKSQFAGARPRCPAVTCGSRTTTSVKAAMSPTPAPIRLDALAEGLPGAQERHRALYETMPLGDRLLRR
jgi:phytoene dehydrogenase-like protein